MRYRKRTQKETLTLRVQKKVKLRIHEESVIIIKNRERNSHTKNREKDSHIKNRERDSDNKHTEREKLTGYAKRDSHYENTERDNIIVSFSSVHLAARKGYYMDGIHFSEFNESYVVCQLIGPLMLPNISLDLLYRWYSSRSDGKSR